MTISPLRLVRTISLIALLAAAPMAASQAQETSPETSPEAAPATAPDSVVATVDGAPITEADLSFAAEDLAQDLAQMPPEEHRAFLLRVLIDMKVMAGAAKAAGMDQAPLFTQRLDYLKDRALRRAYFAQTIAGAVTQERVEAEYAAFTGQFEPQEEVRASHILVASQEEADAVKSALEGGADFATLAKEKSIDPGGANGGDLGFFGRGMMVPSFEEAAFALNAGEVSAPVQSQFGWHVIRLEEKRMSSPPSLEQITGQIQQRLLMQTFNEKVEDLMSGVEIDIADPALAGAMQSQDAMEDAGN